MDVPAHQKTWHGLKSTTGAGVLWDMEEPHLRNAKRIHIVGVNAVNMGVVQARGYHDTRARLQRGALALIALHVVEGARSLRCVCQQPSCWTRGGLRGSCPLSASPGCCFTQLR